MNATKDLEAALKVNQIAESTTPNPQLPAAPGPAVEFNKTISLGDFRVIVETRFSQRDYQTLAVADDGYIGESSILPDNFLLTVEVNPKVRCTGVIMTGAGDKKTMSQSPFRMERGFMIIQRDMRICRNGDDGFDYFRPGQNDIRFALLSGDGSVEYYQVGLVVQLGKLFLATQKKGNGHFYRTEEKILRCTGIRDELQDLLIKVFGKYLEQWVLPGNGADEGVALPESREPGTGVVNWYDDFRQTGMLDVWDGPDNPFKPVAVSWRACPPRGTNGRQYLSPGEIVRIDEIRPRHDTRSKMKEEATKVTHVATVTDDLTNVAKPRQATAATT